MIGMPALQDSYMTQKKSKTINKKLLIMHVKISRLIIKGIEIAVHVSIYHYHCYYHDYKYYIPRII